MEASASGSAQVGPGGRHRWAARVQVGQEPARQKAQEGYPSHYTSLALHTPFASIYSPGGLRITHLDLDLDHAQGVSPRCLVSTCCYHTVRLLKAIKNLNSKLNLEFRVQLRCVSTEEKEVVASKHWNWIDSFTFYENMAAEYQVITNPVVNVTITSTISSFGSERRFQKDLTICNLKVNAWPASFALDHGSFQNMSCTGFGSDSSAQCS